MSASTFAGVVVVAIANLKPALRASLNKRATPVLKGIAPISARMEH
jgi:hypothetical protein